MKKFNYMLLGLAGLAMASCSQDDLVGPANGDGNFNITVKLPGELGTRALSDGKTADNLHIAVYDADNDNAFVFEDNATFGGALETTVSLNLPQGKTYTIAFFAVSEAGEKVYAWDAEAGTITAQYDNYDSDANLEDAYDCFFDVDQYTVPTTATPTTVTLYRPVAQINWGTNDLSKAVVDDNAFGANGQYIVTNLVAENAYSSFNIIDGKVAGEPGKVEINALATPASDPATNWSYPVAPNTYKYIAMQYVLAPASETIYDLTLNIDNSGNENLNGEPLTNEVVVSAAPVQANYRTNIYGALLTNPTEFIVNKDKNWGVPDYDPSLELAILTGGTFTLEHDFELNRSFIINNKLTIDLNGYNLTYTAEGGENYDEQQEGMFYVVPGGNLTIQGQGKVTAEAEYTLIYVDGGELTIEGGNYSAPGLAGQLVYVKKGLAYIKGGSYMLEGQTLDKPYYYPINCKDETFPGVSGLFVSGGSFYNFNPADNIAEGAGKHTNFVEDGYTVVISGEEGDQWFTVVPAGTSMVTNDQELKDALASAKEGDIIYVAAGTYGTLPTGWPAGVTVDCAPGTVFNGQSNPNINGSTIKGATFGSSDYTIRGTVNGNFINCEFLGGFDNARWLYAGTTAYFEGCLFAGSAYACHFDGGANPLTFKSCTFQGFNAFGAAITILTFDSCTFESTGKSRYNGINCWGTTVMNNCAFDFNGKSSDEWIDAIKSLTMYNCTINGVAASSSEVKDYFVTANYGNVFFK